MELDDPPSRAQLQPTDGRAGRVRSMQDALSSRPHRAILYHLQGRGGPATVAAVARAIATSSRSPRGDEGDHDDAGPGAWRRDVRASVLELVDLGLLDYDPATDAARVPEDVTISVAPPSSGAPEPGASAGQDELTGDIEDDGVRRTRTAGDRR